MYIFGELESSPRVSGVPWGSQSRANLSVQERSSTVQGLPSAIEALPTLSNSSGEAQESFVRTISVYDIP